MPTTDRERSVVRNRDFTTVCIRVSGERILRCLCLAYPMACPKIGIPVISMLSRRQHALHCSCASAAEYPRNAACKPLSSTSTFPLFLAASWRRRSAIDPSRSTRQEHTLSDRARGGWSVVQLHRVLLSSAKFRVSQGVRLRRQISTTVESGGAVSAILSGILFVGLCAGCEPTAQVLVQEHQKTAAAEQPSEITLVEGQLAREFGDLLTLDRQVTPSYLFGDFNGDGGTISPLRRLSMRVLLESVRQL